MMWAAFAQPQSFDTALPCGIGNKKAAVSPAVASEIPSHVVEEPIAPQADSCSSTEVGSTIQVLWILCSTVYVA